MNWKRERYEENLVIVERLLAAMKHRFDETLRSSIPISPGLYAISKVNALPGDYLHAGRTGHGKRGLRGRVWDQHFGGGGRGAESDLVQKVQDFGFAQGRERAKAWIQLNCMVQWVVVEDEDTRKWAEHFLLSVLQPLWGS
jgi:hypothetical protein